MSARQTEQLLLEAAERLLGSRSFDPFASISYRRIAEEASFSEATVRKHFPGRQRFVHRLAVHLLARGQGSGSFDAVAFSNGINDRAACLLQSLGDLANDAVSRLAASEEFENQLFLWRFLDRLPDLRPQIVRTYRNREYLAGKIIAAILVSAIEYEHDSLPSIIDSVTHINGRRLATA